MSFIDEYMPEEVPGYPCVSAPRFSTDIRVTAGGRENSNQNWEHPLHRFILPEGIRDTDTVNGLRAHWFVMAGPHHHFPWRDPLDKASIDHVPNLPDATLAALVSRTDQPLGTGDDFTDRFQLAKEYTVGAETYTRTIHLPVLSTVLIAADGVLVPSSDYTVSRPGGEVLFDTPPADNAVLTAGFMFDVEVRFESDDAFEAAVRTWQAAGFADLTLVEVRPC